MIGTAVPEWVLQVLPQWFLARPAFTEAAWATLVSLRNWGTTVFCTLYIAASADGQTGMAFFPWLWCHGAGSLVGFLFTAERAQTAAQKAAKGPHA